MTDVRDDRWHRCKAEIGRHVEADEAAAWLDPLSLDELRPDRIILSGIPNSFFKSRIAARFRPLILQRIRDEFADIPFAPEPDLQLQVGPSHASGSQAPAPSPPPTDRAAESREPNGNGLYAPSPPDTGNAHRLHIVPPPSGEGAAPERPAALGEGAACPLADSGADGAPAEGFATEVLESDCNREVLQFLRQVTAQPGSVFNPLLLVGDTGFGKTHLLAATAKVLETARPDARIIRRTGEEFKNEVLDAITRRAMRPLRETYRSADVLVVDGLEYLLVSPKAQEELIHTFDALTGSHKQMLLAAARFPRALEGIQASLRSRLESGLIVELQPPDLALRRGLVAQRSSEPKSQTPGIGIPEEVADMLARRITRNLRQLEGAVVRLTAHAALYGETITPAFAEKYAQPYFDESPGGGRLPVNRESILERVADKFGLTVRSLKGRSRSAKVVTARQVAIHLLRKLGDYSYAEIGATLGNRSHSTIVHAHQQVQLRFAEDSRYEAMVMDLARGLGE